MLPQYKNSHLADILTATKNLSLKNPLFEALFEHSKDGVALLDETGKPIYVAPSVKSILGYDEVEILEEDFFSLSRKQDADLIIKAFKNSLSNPGKTVAGATVQMRHKDGSWRWIEATLTNRLGDPDVNAIIDNFRDVTEHREIEQKLQYANRIYSFISKINQAIVHLKDQSELFESACEIAVNEGGFEFAWIGLAQEEKGKIDLVANAGANELDLAFFEDYRYDVGGPIDNILQGADYFVISDIDKHKNKNFVEYASKRGFKSAISLSIKKAGSVIGTYNMYSCEKFFFDDKEVMLLCEATRDISFAVDLIEGRKIKLETDRRLVKSEQMLKEAQSTAQIGNWEVEFVTGRGEWSEEALRIFDLPEECKLQNFESFVSRVHPDDKSFVLSELENSLKERRDALMLNRIIYPNGEVRWIFTKAVIQYDNVGVAVGMKGISHDVTSTKQAEVALRESERLNKGIISSLTEQLAVVDRNGFIIMVNQAWEDFARANNSDKKTIKGVGLNYLDVCRKAAATGDEVSDKILKGILAVINREVPNFEFEYPCHSPSEQRWFILQVTALDNDNKIVILHRNNTERKIAQQRLKESEFKYRQIVETAQEGIWVFDEEGITTFVNEKFCQVLGYKKEEILGKPMYDLIESGLEKVSRILKGNVEHRSYHFALKSKIGKRIWTNISANLMFDEDENFRGTLLMVSDITEQKTLEMLLEKTNRMARIGSFDLNFTDGNLFWSDITREIHEVDDEFIPDLENAIGFYKEGIDRNTIKNLVSNMIKDRKPFDAELRIITAKGNEKWIRAIGEPEFQGDKCVRLFGSFQDIHEHKTAELEHIKTFEEKNMILESFGDAFFAVDSDWTITYWNKEAENLLLNKREDVLNQNLWTCFPHYLGSKTYNLYQDAMQKSKTVYFEEYYREWDMWLEVSAFPTPNGLSVFFKDITARKYADLRLKELNESLQKNTEELVLSNKELEQFSYMVSHNLRAPLANIKGLSNELNDQAYDNDTRSILKQELDNSIQKLDDIILDMNYILQAKRDITEHKERVDFSALAESVCASISTSIKKEAATVITDFTALESTVKLKSFMHSIFYNLISNSIKYRKPDVAPVIKISSYKEDGSEVLTFCDNGIGIDMSRHGQRLFKLYSRFHRHIEGKGMGLFMVKTQVETMGGKITIKSEPNKGTEFKIVFKGSSDERI